MGASQDPPAGREEGNFEKQKQMVLCGHCRRIDDARVFLEQNQKALVILRREIFSDPKLDFRIVVKIQVGYIQGNKKGEQQKQ